MDYIEGMREVKEVCKELNFKNLDKLVEKALKIKPGVDPVAILYKMAKCFNKKEKERIWPSCHDMSQKRIARVLDISVSTFKRRLKKSDTTTLTSEGFIEESMNKRINICSSRYYPSMPMVSYGEIGYFEIVEMWKSR